MKTGNETSARVAALFDRLAPVYDGAATRYFPFCADRLVDWLGLRPAEERILDVGTGTGAVAVAAAQRIRPLGRVLAVDVSEKMLDQAWANVRRMGLHNVDLHPMDAARLEFREAWFDRVLSGFSLFFLDDMQAALREWGRVLKPGGQLALSVFAEGAFDPMASIFRRQLEARGIEFPDPPFAWFRLSTPEHCQALLESAGYGDVEIERIQLGYHIEKSLDWWDVIWNTGFRGLVERLDEAGQEALKEEHLQAVEGLFEQGKLWINVPVLLVRARKPHQD